jgi:hypothetical protein
MLLPRRLQQKEWLVILTVLAALATTTKAAWSFALHASPPHRHHNHPVERRSGPNALPAALSTSSLSSSSSASSSRHDDAPTTRIAAAAAAASRASDTDEQEQKLAGADKSSSSRSEPPSWLASDLERHAARPFESDDGGAALQPRETEFESTTRKGKKNKVIIYDTTLRGTRGRRENEETIFGSANRSNTCFLLILT